MPQNNEVTIVLPKLLAGLNGSKGLIRNSRHIAGVMALKDSVHYQVLAQKPLLPHVETPTRARLIRYHSGNPMDWDNAAASFKYLLDAIVKCGIIPDDNPKVITSITCEQYRVKSKKEERMEVTFCPVNEKSSDDPVFFL